MTTHSQDVRQGLPKGGEGLMKYFLILSIIFLAGCNEFPKIYTPYENCQGKCRSGFHATVDFGCVDRCMESYKKHNTN